MMLYLLERDRPGAQVLADALQNALSKVGRCSACRTLAEQALCPICADEQRDPHILCVVETPADVLALEQTGAFKGKYFVLMGHLSPIDGIGPEHIGLDVLAKRFRDEPITEVVLATSTTVEGEATAFFIAREARSAGVAVSRIAQGIPLGGELEYTDANTLALALSGRTVVKES
jgi:recombination protein RecR